MKILQVSHGLPPKENAGVELYTYYLSKALAGLNHRVHVFCREEAPEKEEFSVSVEEYQGLGVTRVVNNLTRVWDPKIFYDNPFFDLAFQATLDREKPDLVHFQHIIALSARLLQISRERGIPVVLTLHDYFLLCHRVQLLKGNEQLCGGPLYGLECASCIESLSPPCDLRTRLFLRLKDILPFPMIKWTKRFFIPPKYLEDRGYEAFHRYRFIYEILKIPQAILTPSHFLRNYFLKYYRSIESKTFVNPLGVFPEGGAFLSQRKPLMEGKEVRFCYYGNILPSKGVHVLLNAFKSIPEGKAKLTIYGSRNVWTETYYDRLKRESAGFVIEFRPSFKRENLSEALSDQDVVVVPSIWPETFSLVIREANSLGLPVVASRIGAIPEAVKEGVNGFLFPPGSVEDLKECMLRFIQDPSLIERMASQMPKTRTLEEHTSELQEIYQRIMKNARRG
jgi:glycosyltransferase involved in cell wall biosynthesis